MAATTTTAVAAVPQVFLVVLSLLVAVVVLVIAVAAATGFGNVVISCRLPTASFEVNRRDKFYQKHFEPWLHTNILGLVALGFKFAGPSDAWELKEA